jgi:hypothetical protein
MYKANCKKFKNDRLKKELIGEINYMKKLLITVLIIFATITSVSFAEVNPVLKSTRTRLIEVTKKASKTLSVNACKHPSNKISKINYKYLSTAKHTYTKRCNSCGVNIQFNVAENHMFTNGKCVYCGYCTHSNISKKDYKNISDTSHTYTKYCTTCGQNLQLNVKEGHSYNGGVCICGKPNPAFEYAKQYLESFKDPLALTETIAKNQQESEMARWKILQDTQTKCFEIQQDVSVNQTKTHDKMFSKWSEYIRP